MICSGGVGCRGFIQSNMMGRQKATLAQLVLEHFYEIQVGKWSVCIELACDMCLGVSCHPARHRHITLVNGCL